ncbi:MAG: hypothetical protein EOO41_02430, partial [Methanobacteriota archaeon]
MRGEDLLFPPGSELRWTLPHVPLPATPQQLTLQLFRGGSSASSSPQPAASKELVACAVLEVSRWMESRPSTELKLKLTRPPPTLAAASAAGSSAAARSRTVAAQDFQNYSLVVHVTLQRLDAPALVPGGATHAATGSGGEPAGSSDASGPAPLPPRALQAPATDVRPGAHVHSLTDDQVGRQFEGRATDTSATFVDDDAPAPRTTFGPFMIGDTPDHAFTLSVTLQSLELQPSVSMSTLQALSEAPVHCWLSYVLFESQCQTGAFALPRYEPAWSGDSSAQSLPHLITFPPVTDAFLLHATPQDLAALLASNPILSVYLCTEGLVLGCARIPLRALALDDDGSMLEPENLIDAHLELDVSSRIQPLQRAAGGGALTPATAALARAYADAELPCTLVSLLSLLARGRLASSFLPAATAGAGASRADATTQRTPQPNAHDATPSHDGVGSSVFTPAAVTANARAAAEAQALEDALLQEAAEEADADDEEQAGFLCMSPLTLTVAQLSVTRAVSAREVLMRDDGGDASASVSANTFMHVRVQYRGQYQPA